MKKYIGIVILVLIVSCKGNKSIDLERIYAWCIVPFDAVERTPEQRIIMLKELGITKYGYDWRKQHLPEMAKELQLAKENNIDVVTVWLWIDNNWDSLERLNDANEKVFSILKEVGYEGQIWVGFHANFFQGLSEADAIKKGASMIEKLSKRAAALQCKIGLYNHGDWFGEPENQLKIIKTIPDEDIGLIYNFHHAHHQISDFPEMATSMLPYLWSVNLNGLRKGGPKILPIGEGDHEAEMIKVLLEKGYKGDFGILGHVEDADVQTVLKTNLDGLLQLDY